MDTQQTKFDWNAWYAGIPGIPADWGQPATPAPATAPANSREPAEPVLLEAA